MEELERLFEEIKMRVNPRTSDRQLAALIGIGSDTCRRARMGITKKLNSKAQKTVARFLAIPPEELEHYFEGKIGIDAITKNLPVPSSDPEESSAYALQQIRDFLKSLNPADLGEVCRITQNLYWGTLANYRMHLTPVEEESALFSRSLADLLKVRNLERVNRITKISPERLNELKEGSQPTELELTVLDAALPEDCIFDLSPEPNWGENEETPEDDL